MGEVGMEVWGWLCGGVGGDKREKMTQWGSQTLLGTQRTSDQLLAPQLRPAASGLVPARALVLLASH